MRNSLIVIVGTTGKLQIAVDLGPTINTCRNLKRAWRVFTTDKKCISWGRTSWDEGTQKGCDDKTDRTNSDRREGKSGRLRRWRCCRFNKLFESKHWKYCGVKLIRVGYMILGEANARSRTVVLTIVSNISIAHPDVMILLAGLDSNVLLKIFKGRLA